LLSHTDSLNGSEWCELADILKQKSSIEDYEKLVAFCLNKAVVENDLTATMKLGFFYKEECKTRRAFNAFKMAAINFNHDKAWFELGNLYEEKSRYRKDDVAMLLLQDALDCYFIAVNQGYADAAWKIYSLFYDSILENKILAKYWFDIAVEMGAVLAWVALADNYQACSFADEANSEKAFSWYQKAALKGDIESIKKSVIFMSGVLAVR
jgi:TPR repeat protein